MKFQPKETNFTQNSLIFNLKERLLTVQPKKLTFNEKLSDFLIGFY